MSKSNDAWGIEVGQNAIKGIRLQRDGDDVSMVEYDILPFKTVLSTPDIDADEAIRLGLDQFMSRHDLKHSNVVVSIPGRMAFARFAKLPPVDPKTIPKMVEFEAKQQIPFPIDQVEWDYQVFQQEDSPDVEVGIFAIPKERVAEYLSNFRMVDMKVDGLTLSPLAVYNGMVHDMGITPDSEGLMLVDIGTTATDVIIVEQGQVWLRTLPIGGNNFTQALVKAFKLSFPKAEKLKREAATSKYARQIFQAMRPIFADMVSEMQKTLGFYKSMNRDADIKVLMGLGSTFRLPGLQKFLKQQLQMEVTRPQGFKRINVEGKHQAEFADQALTLSTAYGLALQGIGMEQVSANLLPARVLKQRLWKAKQPWFAAAAMLLLAAGGVAQVKLMLEKGTHASELQTSNSVVQPVTGEATDLLNQWNQIEAQEDPRQRIENLRRVLDYRDVWPKLLQDLSTAHGSLNPDPVLFSNKSKDVLEKFPQRSDRRRIYVESLTANYIVPAETGADQKKPAKNAEYGAASADTIWKEGSTQPPPRFEVVIQGKTTHSDASALLASFVRWFEKNVAKDRPYKLVPGSARITDLRPVVEEIPTEIQTRPGGRPGFGNSGGLDEGVLAGRPTGRPTVPRPGAQPKNGENEVELVDLFPERPFAKEEVKGDNAFVVTWQVEMLPPNRSRGGDAPQADASQPVHSTSRATQPAKQEDAS